MTNQEDNKIVSIRLKRIVSPLILDVINDFDWKTCKNDEEASFIFFDGIFSLEKYTQFPPNKKVNKIPGMNKICYKSNLFDVLQEAKKLFKEEYSCIPDTYTVTRSNFNETIDKICKKDENKLWIFKPESSYGGKGISIFSKKSDMESYQKPNFVIQSYISPKLYGGYKFDFRLYILITNLEPLTIYIYNEGIARFCSEKYDKNNLQNSYSHLTNVSINRKNESSSAKKEHIQLYSKIIDDILQNNNERKEFLRNIKKLSGKIILALYDKIKKNVNEACDANDKAYENNNSIGDKIQPLNRFFHLLGADILIDENFKPYLLELNDNPALKCFNDLEVVLKDDLLKGELSLICEDLKINIQDDNFKRKWEKITFEDDDMKKIKQYYNIP